MGLKYDNKILRIHYDNYHRHNDDYFRALLGLVVKTPGRSVSRYKYRAGFAPSELRKKMNGKPVINFRRLKDKIDFGKYRMRTWEDVILEDPEYIQWAFDNIKNFFLDEEATKVWRNRMLAKEADENQN